MISYKFVSDYLSMMLPDKVSYNEDIVNTFIDFFESYIEASSMAILAIDKDRKIVVINSLASAIFEEAEENLINKSMNDALPSSPLTKGTLRNYKSLPKIFKYKEKKLSAERTLIYANGIPVALFSSFQDITFNEITTEKLNLARKQELFLSDIIENSYDGIYITDSDGKTILVNKAYERISGLSRKKLIGSYISDLVAEGILSTSLTEEVVKTKDSVTKTQHNPNNKELIITGSPIFDKSGNVQNVITNVRDVTELVNLNKKLETARNRAMHYQNQLMKESSDENIVYASEQFKNILSISGKVSKMDSTVLILGETGVGKEIVAQHIHKNSTRTDKPYIKINCGAIPATLLESELFGYAPGAFTGASSKGKPGRFELADTGTLFLDEIGELPLELQSSLLRVLQDGEVTRVGGSSSKKIDVRIIAATNRDLESMISKGTFRSDLYYRLNVVSINIPPLRERKSDIPPLAEKTLLELNDKYKTNKSLSPEFIDSLMLSEWPGNIRELKNFIEKQYVLSDDNYITLSHPLIFTPHIPRQESTGEAISGDDEKIPTYASAKAAMETELFSRAMKAGGSTYKAASLLGMSQSTFFRKYKELFPNKPG